MNIAAIIVGIDGWEKYTLPLTESIHRHEPQCTVVVVDNESVNHYPRSIGRVQTTGNKIVWRTDARLCYSAAINFGKAVVDNHVRDVDWYIVLSNDVLCTGPFADILAAYGNGDIAGPLLKNVHGFPYLEGWCVCVPSRAWDAVGGWDVEFLGSDYEDVDFSTSARERGFGLIEDANLPFVHLDQRQRYHVVDDFSGKNIHNMNLFLRKHATVTA